MESIKKENCSGCSACASVCPQDCIKMIADKEGFLYPHINEGQCIGCKLCDKICPINSISEKSTNKNIVAYAALSKQNDIREKSSSGGIFSLIAENVIKNSGVVFGASFDNEFNVVHKKIDNIEDLHELRGSKYVQSEIGKTFIEAERELKSGRLVLFSGAPCQISGFMSLLGKTYDNLITVDFICHGVPSPYLWNKYKEYSERVAKSKLNSVSFRCKEKGWKDFSMHFLFENNHCVLKSMHKDPYIQMFLKDLCLRPSCYNCKFKTKHRQSDITLADFWGIENVLPKMDDDKGTSLVVVNSEKGEGLFNDVKGNAIAEIVNLDDAIRFNSAMIRSVKKPVARDRFMSDLNRLSFPKLYKKYCKTKLKVKLKILLSKIKRRIIRSK